MRIAVVGGGPGGLFAATLIKRSDPAHEVTVFERNRAGDTFGFGVVFSDATLGGIHAADPVLLTALSGHGVHWDDIEVRLHGERHRCGGNGMATVERRTLLALSQQQAAGEGVDVRLCTGVDARDVMAAGYDLVVAATPSSASGSASTRSWPPAPCSSSTTCAPRWPPRARPASNGPSGSKSSPNCRSQRPARSTRRRCVQTSRRDWPAAHRHPQARADRCPTSIPRRQPR